MGGLRNRIRSTSGQRFSRRQENIAASAISRVLLRERQPLRKRTLGEGSAGFQPAGAGIFPATSSGFVNQAPAISRVRSRQDAREQRAGSPRSPPACSLSKSRLRFVPSIEHFGLAASREPRVKLRLPFGRLRFEPAECIARSLRQGAKCEPFRERSFDARAA